MSVELENALKLLQNLRSSVGHVFEKLVDGVKNSQGQENERQFLSDLSQDLQKVNKCTSDLETLSKGISSPGLPLIGNSSILTLDATTDKTQVSAQLTNAYKWANKASDHAFVSLTMLQGNILKRSTTSTSLSSKRTRIGTHDFPSNFVDQVINNFKRMPGFSNMTITVKRPLGNQAVLQITLGKVLQALIVLRGLIIEYVTVRGFSEDITLENGQLDIWGKSKYAVFRKVTDYTTAAMLHFSLPQQPDKAIQSFLVWLNSYQKLFSAPCCRCKRHLVNNLPPTWRDFKTLEMCHDECRQC